MFKPIDLHSSVDARVEPREPCTLRPLITTLVALVALAAVVIGVLALVATLRHIGLGPLDHLGVYGGVAFLCGGILTAIILAAVTCGLRARKNKKDLERQEESPGTRVLEPLYWHHRDCNERLQALYGNKEQPELILWSHKVRDEVLIEKQKTLILADDQEILGLTIDKITLFSYEERAVLSFRLAALEEKGVPVNPDKQWDGSLNTLTLAQLRELQCTQEMLASLSPPLLGLLSSRQLDNIFKTTDKVSAQHLADFLPTSTPEEEKYTRVKLGLLSEESVLKQIGQFSPQQLHFLPLSYFQKNLIPWHNLHSQEKLSQLLNTEKPYDEKTKNILQTMSIELIQQLASFMDVILLNQFDHKKQIGDRQFPWSPFIAKQGVGTQMRSLNANLLTQAPIPWAELAQHAKEVHALFSTGSVDREYNCQILQNLSYPQLHVLAPALWSPHIAYFDVKQLQHPDFPWALFLLKSQIGLQLASNHANHLHTFSIPWQELAKRQQEVSDLFDLYQTNKQRTESIFQNLPPTIINDLAPALKAEHTLYFRDAHFNDAQFPWSVVLNKKGIEGIMPKWKPAIQLRALNSADFPWTSFLSKENVGDYMRQWDTQVIIQAPIPWAEVAKHSKVVHGLFRTWAGDHDRNRHILKSLPEEQRNQLKPAFCNDSYSYFK